MFIWYWSFFLFYRCGWLERWRLPAAVGWRGTTDIVGIVCFEITLSCCRSGLFGCYTADGDILLSSRSRWKYWSFDGIVLYPNLTTLDCNIWVRFTLLSVLLFRWKLIALPIIHCENYRFSLIRFNLEMIKWILCVTIVLVICIRLFILGCK